MIFDDLSHGVHDFSVEGPEVLEVRTVLAHFGGHHDRKHKNEHEEAAQAQPSKKNAKIRPHANFQVNLSTRKKVMTLRKFHIFLKLKMLET